MTGQPKARVFYRLIAGRTAILRDFESNAARKGPHPDPGATPEELELWEGVSVTDAIAGSRARAMYGTHVAVLAVLADGPIRFRQTLWPGHYTLWGTPATLLACVSECVKM